MCVTHDGKCYLKNKFSATVEQLKEVVFPHPTVSEILKETVFTIR